MSLSLILGCVSLWSAPTGAADSYVPDSPDTVLLTLPATLGGPDQDSRYANQREVSELTDGRGNIQAAIARAKGYLDTAKSLQDARWYGFAQTALLPWWEDSGTPRDFALLKADILQHQHRFAESRDVLNAVIKQHPRDPQAVLNRAHMHLKLADFTRAEKDCQRLLLLDSPAVAAHCLASVKGLTGQGADALALLENTLAQAAQLPEDLVFELHLSAALIAHREQDMALAERHYQRAMALSPQQVYLLTHYSDLLLERRKPEIVLSVIEADTPHRVLQIKRAQALVQLDPVAAQRVIDQMGRRFDAEAFFNDVRMHQASAMYRLFLRSDAQGALPAALAHWADEQSPDSARLLIEAAAAAGQIRPAEAAIAYIRQSGVYDYRIERALSRLPRWEQSA
ncbi:MAG TPA: hypothetical protein DD979_07945 [Gammaproteobacteria bacterium]|nr:hypothetical protein [Gammaproteobacteria bacterium]